MKNLPIAFALILLLTSRGLPDGADLVRSSGITGGFIVHLGCGDGRLTGELRLHDGFAVQGLDRDAGNIIQARNHLQSLGLYGKVSADTFDGVHLPYVDNMVNLLIADGLGAVSRAEVLRVLAPRGVALIGGKKTVKPLPAEIDEWTHYLHGPDNNAVARDTEVGPPRRLQWQGGPKWPRHHDKMSSLSALVSSGGRIFYILDEGSTASIFLPSRWALIARDGFNGKILWKRSIGDWYYRFKGLKDGPADAPRRLVASGERVYATLSLQGPLTALEASTGKTVREYPGTGGAEEILLSRGVLFMLAGPGSIGDGRRKFRPVERRAIRALRADSGEMLWEAVDVVAAATMAVDGGQLYYFNFEKKRVIALDRETGEARWSSGPLPAPAKQTSFFASRLVVQDGVVLLASGEYSGMTKSGGGELRSDTLTALSAESGKTLWTAPHPPSGYSSPENLFVINGVVWFDSSSNGKLDGTVTGRDLKTGEVRASFPADEKNYWFHHRCYPGRATSNYILTSRTGLEFIDYRKEHWDLNHWVRGACLYGVMPCNGLVYTPPAPCICYAETYLHSFNAFAPGDGRKQVEPSPADRLERGPAHGDAVQGKPFPGDWPTYRGDNGRSGSTGMEVPATLKPSWDIEIGGKLSSLTIGEGRVFLAAVDRHTVYAIEAGTGRELWHYTAGGRVDSPPTCHRGRILFGSADGYVYCLRGRDGALIWRFLAAPVDRRILAYGQIESLWPVHGSILVRDGIAHFVAGRSIFVDGGMRFYRLDVETGRIISVTALDERNPATGNNVQELVKWLNMPVGRPDILSCDEKRIYMRSQAFNLEGQRLGMGPLESGPQEGKNQGGEGTHLFCPTGFLDDTWFHRTYWLYGRTWGSGWNGYYIAGKHAPAGKIICAGQDWVYVFGRQPRYYRWTTPMEFRLFAARKEWEAPPRKAVSGGDDTKEKKAGKAKKTRKKKNAGKAARRAQAPAPVTYEKNYRWSRGLPILVRAMTLAGQTLFVAGPEDILDETGKAAEKEDLIRKQEAALQGRSGGRIWAVSAEDGRKLHEYRLDSPPFFDGMAAAGGRLYVTTLDGKLRCFR